MDESDDEEWLPPREKMNKRGKEKEEKKEKKVPQPFWRVHFNPDNRKLRFTKLQGIVDEFAPNKAADEMTYNKIIMNYDIGNSKVKSNPHSYISFRISQLTWLINKFENKYNPYYNNQRDYIFLHSVTEGMNVITKINFFKKFIKLINPNVNINDDNNVIEFIMKKYNLNNMDEVNNYIASFFGEKMYLENIITILDYLDKGNSITKLFNDKHNLCLSFYIQTAYIYIDWVQKNRETLYKNDPHNGRNNEQLISNIWFYITDYLLLRSKVKFNKGVERYRKVNNNSIDLEFLFFKLLLSTT